MVEMPRDKHDKSSDRDHLSDEANHPKERDAETKAPPRASMEEVKEDAEAEDRFGASDN